MTAETAVRGLRAGAPYLVGAALGALVMALAMLALPPACPCVCL